jgi:hypothetical protein
MDVCEKEEEYKELNNGSHTWCNMDMCCSNRRKDRHLAAFLGNDKWKILNKIFGGLLGV